MIVRRLFLILLCLVGTGLSAFLLMLMTRPRAHSAILAGKSLYYLKSPARIQGAMHVFHH